MRKGFTIIELLVASLLLGMLVTILTMVFSQSSIAWRLGAASVSKVGDICDNVAELRDEADNAFVWNNEVHRMTGLWDKNGNLRDRACDAPSSQTLSEDSGKLRANILRNKGNLSNSSTPRDFRPINVGQVKNAGSQKTYFVNVMSAGPDKQFDTYDDIWSFPDDFE